MSPTGSQTPTPLAEPKKLTFGTHVANVSRLMVKELRSIRADPTMLILVIYAFSISVNTVVTGAVTEASNLSIGIADEDGSQLSRQIAEAFVPPTFQRSVQIRSSDIDSEMDRGNLILTVEIPPNFQAEVSTARKTSVQVNVDATAIAQAGNGASYTKNVIANEVQNFLSGREGGKGAPISPTPHFVASPRRCSSVALTSRSYGH